MPEGFRYEEDIITEAEEASLAESLSTLELNLSNSMATSAIAGSLHSVFGTTTHDAR